MAADNHSKLYLDTKPVFDVRYRHELVTQQGIEQLGRANTVCTRKLWLTLDFNLGADLYRKWVRGV